MQFCKDCGGVLNLFNNNESELCSACIQHQKKLAEKEAPLPEEKRRAITSENLLGEAVLAVENGRIVLRAKEGWELWSAPATTPTVLSTALNQALRIYEIRRRRLKKK